MKREFNFLKFIIISLLGTVGIVLIFTVFIFNSKSIDELTSKDFIPVFSVFLVFGMKDFQKYLKYKESITKGIRLLKEGSVWGVDNLIISLNTDQTNQIIVRNDLLWIEKHDYENTNDLLKRLILDFEIICRNGKFKAYLENKTVQFNLYTSDLRDEQLLKTEERNYA